MLKRTVLSLMTVATIAIAAPLTVSAQQAAPMSQLPTPTVVVNPEVSRVAIPFLDGYPDVASPAAQ